MELSQRQVEQVEERLRSAGIDSEGVFLSLLDHVCCAIEERLEHGKDFDRAFEESFSVFGEFGLLRIQQETTILLNQKTHIMKPITFISGLSCSLLLIAGTVFKMLHWPGANMLVLAGVLFLLVLFLPNYFLERIRLEQTRMGLMAQLAAWIGGTALLLGTTFKMMHWPFAYILIYSGTGILFFIHLPMLLYKNAQERVSAGKNKIVVTVFMLAMAGIMLSNAPQASSTVAEGLKALDMQTKTVLEEEQKQYTRLLLGANETQAAKARKIISSCVLDAQSLSNADDVSSLVLRNNSRTQLIKAYQAANAVLIEK